MNGQFNYIVGAFTLFLCITGCFLFVNSLHFTTVPEQSSIIDYRDAPKKNPEMPDNIAVGKTLFMANCASCHNIFKDGTGPSLLGFEDRGPWGDRIKIYEWIKNPAAFMRKDSYTRELKERFGSLMTAFPSLTHQEIDAIAAYINYNSQKEQVFVD